jgi:hypothetical protein
MKKRAAITLLLLLSGLSSLLAGCSSDKHMVKNCLTQCNSVNVVRHETPGILRNTSAETWLMAVTELAAPGGASLLILGDEYSRARGTAVQDKIPDFGLLLLEKFADRIRQERKDWPMLAIYSTPVSEDLPLSGIVIDFEVKRLAYGTLDLTRGGVVMEGGRINKGIISDGFLSKTVVTMKDQKDEVLWQKSFTYLSADHDREMALDVLESDNASLLKEEIDFAADMTVANFLDHLKETPE